MRFAITFLAALLMTLAPAAHSDDAATGRTWAAHVDIPGVPNAAKVNDHLYRGAQPTPEGLKELEKMGIRTVVNFRAHHSDEDVDTGTGLTFIHIPMHAAHPEIEDIVAFLKIAADTNRWPIFYHCKHGADRTGLQTAVCRMVFDGWSTEEAVDEMMHGGFGFHEVYKEIADAVLTLDAADLRVRAGLAAAPRPLRILALGDSYTIGEGVDENARWPNQLAEILRAGGRTVEPPQIIAATGWTTFDLHRATSRASLEPPYDLVTLLIGVNDQYQGQSAESYSEQFAKLLADAESFTGGATARVVVLSIPDYSLTPFAAKMDTARIRAELAKFNGINREAAWGAGATYVDLSEACGKVVDHPELLAADGLHPAAQLYAEWAKRVADAVGGILK